MSIQIHVARTDNPHEVTKEQVGLGNLENFPVADTNTVLSMSSAFHYIPVDGLPAVKTAFINYMKSIGLMDELGNFIRIPVDTLGSVWFILQDSDFILAGNHPTGTTVDAIISSDGVTVAIIPKVPITNGRWDMDLSGITLVPGNTYVANLVYWDAAGVEISTAEEVVKSVGISIETFEINDDTELGYLDGLTNNYDRVSAIVTQNGVTVFSGDALIVGNVYTFNMLNIVFDKTLTYTATVIGHYGDLESLPIVVDNTIGVSPLGTLTYIDPATGLTNIDFREFTDLSDVGLYYVDEGAL